MNKSRSIIHSLPFVDFHAGLLLDPVKFNRDLMDWLIFYNTERVHCAFGNKLSPMEFLAQSPSYQLTHPGLQTRVGLYRTFILLSFATILVRGVMFALCRFLKND